MECNREEAVRAKGIAENKMLNKDFIGARKIVLKAQQLYPDLENVSQMLTVCEIHCSAENKLNGEMDWYGILQVPTTADELTIKKQYRKLALLLHPDKNKFGGAEAAFKLVGEAHRTLTDKSKRVLHDMKRAASFRMVPARQPAPQTNRSSSIKKQPGVASTFANSTFAQSNGFNQQQSASFSSNQTFWTICPACGIRYQYYQSIMNRALRCQSCKKPFIAYDINAHSVPSAAPWNRNGIPAANFTGPKSNFGSGSDMGSRGNVVGGSASGFTVEIGGASNNNKKEDVKADVDGGTDAKFEKVKLQEVKKREQVVKPSAGSRTQKRRRKLQIESSESESSDSDVVVEGVYPSGQNMGTAGSCPRRSSRQKQNISYSEHRSDDDDFVRPKHKRSRTYDTPGYTDQDDLNCVDGQTSEAAASAGRKHGAGSGSLPNGVQKKDGKEQGSNIGVSEEASPNGDFSFEASPDDPEAYTYPEPEFYDFDEAREESKFAVGQIWAVYDNFDAMPRYYAWIRHVHGPKFKLRFNWLEYDPTSIAETQWYDGGLPVGCGTFKLGRTEQTEERLMFSHIMPGIKGEKKNPYGIFPRKREVWAMFKNWDIEWSSCMDANRHYEYEIVEVISDFTESDVLSVVRLIKVQGFVSLFVQAIDNGSIPLNIQMKDILRFSHSIPSYRLKGNEREGIPKGSLELDCASLPLNFAETFPSISVDSLMGRSEDLNNVRHGLYSTGSKDEVPTCTGDRSSSEGNGTAVGSQYCASEQMTFKEQVGAKENVGTRDADSSKTVKDHSVSQQPLSIPNNWYEYPDAEFHNFGEERLEDKFEEGQIWALYSEVDKNPNYYGRITKVELESFKVHLNWLEGYCEQEHEKFWFDEQLPVGCGTLKVTRESSVLDTTDTFSHLVQANPTAKKNHYSIYPCTGEIWAVYKNWSLGWTHTDHENCDFHVVEILHVNSLGFQASVLSKVNGYRAVFKAESGASARTMFIPFAERLKFSHRIPSFRLTEERGGKLRGYWELDPGAIPDLLLVDDST